MGVKEDFAARLKKLRELAGYTQSQLADKLGISRGSISFYENGSRTPDIEILDNVCLFFGVPTDYMLGYVNTLERKNENIGFRLGLSDKSISILENAYFNVDYLNKIIEHKYFEKLMNLISLYLNDKDSTKKINSIINNSSLSNMEKLTLSFYFDIDKTGYTGHALGRPMFLQYQCNHLFSMILEEAYSDMPAKELTKEELEASEASYQKAKQEYEKMHEENEAQSERDLKEYRETHADEISARNAIYNALSNQNKEGVSNGDDSKEGK